MIQQVIIIGREHILSVARKAWIETSMAAEVAVIGMQTVVSFSVLIEGCKFNWASTVQHIYL